MDSSKHSRPGTAQLKRVNLPEQQGDLEEYIQVLYEHQKSCEQGRKYIEAEAAKRRLQELKKELDSRSKVDLVQKHQSEKEEFDKAQLEEFNQFNEFWDNKMSEFDQEAQNVKEQTIQRHKEELEQFIQQLEESIPQQPKDTAELLSLRTMEQQLAKQEQYMEAHQIQQRIAQLEQEEYEKWSYARTQKIRNNIQVLKQKQGNEMNALDQRIFSGQEEQRKCRSQELEKLLQKYQNVRKDLESQQNQQLNKLEKSQKSQCKDCDELIQVFVKNAGFQLVKTKGKQQLKCNIRRVQQSQLNIYRY